MSWFVSTAATVLAVGATILPNNSPVVDLGSVWAEARTQNKSYNDSQKTAQDIAKDKEKNGQQE